MPVNQGIYGVNPGSTSSTYKPWKDLPGGAPSSGGMEEYTPPKTKVKTEPVGDPLRGVGSIEGNITDPAGTAQQAAQETTDVLAGLKSFLFGVHDTTVTGSHGGVLGDVPIVGNIGRAATDVVSAGVGGAGEWLGTGLHGLGGALEHVSFGVSEDLQTQFNMIPDTFEAKREALAKIESDGNNYGLLGAAGHYMADAIKRYREDLRQRELKPDLTENLFMENASLADTVSNLFGVFGWTQRLAERGWAGMAIPGEGNRNRLQRIIDVGDGKDEFQEDKGILGTGLLAGGGKGLNSVEQQVYDMYKGGLWNETEALDFLASHGAGISHAASMQVLGTIAIDPLNIASFGALGIAKLGHAGVALVRMERLGQEMLKVAKTADEAAQANKIIQTARGGIQSADSVRAYNVLGQIAKMKTTGNITKSFGAFYEAMAVSHWGKVAKGARTIIDPLHLWGDLPKVRKAVDVGSLAVSETMAKTHGAANYGKLGWMLGALPGAGETALDEFHRGLSVYSANVFTRIASRRYQAVQAWRGTLRELRNDPTTKGIKQALLNATENTLVRMEEEVERFIKRDWTDDDLANLAMRAERFIGGGMSEDGWLDFVTGLTVEQRSLLHSSTYGLAVSRLHRAIEDARAAGQAWTLNFNMDDLILLNRQTLTDLGLKGIRDRMKAVEGNNEAVMAVIEAAKRQYPDLRRFTGDPTSMSKTIQGFTEHLDNIAPRLPHQIENIERGQLPGHLARFDSLISPDPNNGVFTLGFKPKAEFRWGIEEDATGALHVVGDPFFDQISDVNMTGLPTFRGIREASYNAAGMPIGTRTAARLLDRSEWAARTLFRGVTGSMVTQAAHSKFVARLMPRLREAGLDESAAEAVWEALRKAVDARADVSGMRGLGQHDMWTAVREVTRQWPSSAGYGPRELMLDVMHAYEGDLRTVGLTQKFTGRVKTMLAQYTDRNIGGVVGEHIWPMLKFRYNPIFQVQEKVEPWVLSSGRGAKTSLGRTPTELDRQTAALYRRYIESNLVAMADQDIAELSAKFAIGSELEILSMGRDAAIGKITKHLTVDSLLDVQGTKRLNMLRTFRKGLAQDMRASWDRHKPGEFDRMLDYYRGQAGYLMDEDDFAVRFINENLNANDVTVREYRDADGKVIGWDVDYDNSIRTGWEAAPQHIGELRALDINRMVRRLALEDDRGFLLGNEMDLRRALASGKVSIDRVTRELRELNAHPEYIRRVETALRFNWQDFWRDVKSQFGLAEDEVARLKDFYGRAAEARGMTPVEYMSQVYSPNIARGGAGGVGSLGAAVDLMRNGRPVTDPTLAVLVAGQGADSRALFKQMAAVAVVHMDPSGKAALMRALIGTENFHGPLWEFRASPLFDSIDGIENLWDASHATDHFADRLMGYFQGTPPTGARVDIPVDDLPELAFLRNKAVARLTAEGRPPHNGRFTVEPSEALQQEAAELMRDMPVWFHVSRFKNAGGRVRVTTDPNMPGAYTVESLKTKTAGLGDLTGEARTLPVEQRNYLVDYINETRRLYQFIEGELGIKISTVRGKARPYADADALRADLARKGSNGRPAPRLRVQEEGHYIPGLSNEDAFMARVVQDVFGYGMDRTQFGDDAALFRAMEQYGGSSRSVMLTNDWGRRAVARWGDEVIPDDLTNVDGIAAFEAKWGRATADTAPGPVPRKEGGKYVEPRDVRDEYFSRTLGRGVRELDEAGQREFVMIADQMRTIFGGVEFNTFDIFDDAIFPGGAPTAATYVNDAWETPGIVMARRTGGWHMTAAERADWDNKAFQTQQGAHMNQYAKWTEKEMVVAGLKVKVPRMTYEGKQAAELPFNTRSHVSYSRQGTVVHEVGHLIDSELHRRTTIRARKLVEAEMNGGRKAPQWAHQAVVDTAHGEYTYYDKGFTAFMRRLNTSGIRRRISGYAQTTYNQPSSNTNNADLMAELNSLAFADDVEFERHWAAYQRLKAAGAEDIEVVDTGFGDKVMGPLVPEHDLPPGFLDGEDPNWVPWAGNFITPQGVYDGELLEAVNEYRQHLQRLKVYTPDAVGQKVVRKGSSLDDGTAKVAKGSWEPEYRMGAFPQEFTDEVTKHYLGTGRYAESNPDMARAAHHVQRTMTDASESFFARIGEGTDEIFDRQAPDFTWDDVFGSTSGMPHVKGQPFDYTQGLLWDAAVQSMASKWEDAFRLQYFAQNRSMLQRSINHPMFGLYPASYMWGKVGPELIKFIALQPFGLNTGAGLRTLADMQMAIGMQRTYDPEFDAKIEELGHSAALDFLSYLLPATPWSVPASYPAWMRSFAQQGLEQEQDIEAGRMPDDIDWVAPLTNTLKRITPHLTYVPWMGRAGAELFGAPKEGTPEYDQWLSEQIAKRAGSQPVADEAAPVEAEPVDLSGPTPGASLQPVLLDQMQELQRVLGQ